MEENDYVEHVIEGGYSYIPFKFNLKWYEERKAKNIFKKAVKYAIEKTKEVYSMLKEAYEPNELEIILKTATDYAIKGSKEACDLLGIAMTFGDYKIEDLEKRLEQTKTVNIEYMKTMFNNIIHKIEWCMGISKIKQIFPKRTIGDYIEKSINIASFCWYIFSDPKTIVFPILIGMCSFGKDMHKKILIYKTKKKNPIAASNLKKLKKKLKALKN